MDYEKKYNEALEKVCGTCTYWQEGTLDRGQCQAGEPHQTHSAETCDRWERHEEIQMKEQPCEDLEARKQIEELENHIMKDKYGTVYGYQTPTPAEIADKVNEIIRYINDKEDKK